MHAANLPNNLPVITAVHSVEEARSLPAGSLIGDSHGGVTFSDAVAHVLETAKRLRLAGPSRL